MLRRLFRRFWQVFHAIIVAVASHPEFELGVGYIAPLADDTTVEGFVFGEGGFHKFVPPPFGKDRATKQEQTDAYGKGGNKKQQSRTDKNNRRIKKQRNNQPHNRPADVSVVADTRFPLLKGDR